MGIVSPIILDLDGNGVQTRSAEQSRARFDMNGDGTRDDTSWIGATEGFLYLDRDGNGTLSGIAEMSFTADVPGADSDLAGLAAFDSNDDGKISADDDRFGDFGVWCDRDGDGVVDNGETLRFSDIGLESIDLNGAATSETAEPGDVAVVNTGSWTRADGMVMDLADAKMTYFDRPEVSHSPALQTLLSLRERGFFSNDLDWSDGTSAIRDADDHLVAGRSATRPLTETTQHDPAYPVESLRAGAGVEPERRLALMTQDLAAFGGDSSSRLDLRHWDNLSPLAPNLA